VNGNGLPSSLARKKDVATQPCEGAQQSFPNLLTVLYRLEEGTGVGARAEGARRLWDSEDAFRGRMSEDI